ncbi:MAG TPA: MBL fold metallo-hydrolase [Chryseolinea sp.]|nr:MBL fold metallo-hydrolase [Chryseolinea sp.]HPH45565.1 MBL fold metallo-hydrolase [Chryseolinea sp.]HPM29003.1 MBL fold metallo-hydrolase [Chryseolinea sp.]
MSLFIASINSGSNANCYYVGNRTEAVLIDAGVSCRETETRMKRLGLSMKKVKAIFISHEHGDHIGGLRSLIKKYPVPVYITPETMREGKVSLRESLVHTFLPHESISIGNLSVTPFPKFHDASDPHSFIVEHEQVKVGVITDIGIACENVIRYFKQCHAAFLESNFDDHMLETGRYPLALKNRIRGGKGHISNKQALELFKNHAPSFMSHLILSHLSQHNNTPGVAMNLFKPHAGNTEIIIASRKEPSEVYHIENTVGIDLYKPKVSKALQLSLFS